MQAHEPKVRFGPAGIPIACNGGSLEGVTCTHELGLRAMELEFVRGANMGLELAQKIGRKAKELDVKLSAHAPYYINLLSEKPETRKASIERILQTARIVHTAGGGRIAYHAAYYGKLPPEQALKELKESHQQILEKMKKEKITSAILAPETSGGQAEWGELNELLELCGEFDLKRINPTLDFSHLHGRPGKGWLYKKENYQTIFNKVEKALGKKAVESFHSHFQSLAFGARGELHHLTIDQNEPPFQPLAELLAEQGYSGTIISESPNIETDALKMQRAYTRLLKH